MMAGGWMDGFLCTGAPPKEKYVWYGDSGSPIFVQKDGISTQLSIVSWNTPEDTQIEWDTDHDMSADVFFYLKWIKKNMV